MQGAYKKVLRPTLSVKETKASNLERKRAQREATAGVTARCVRMSMPEEEIALTWKGCVVSGGFGHPPEIDPPTNE